MYQPLSVSPPVFANISENAFIFTSAQPKQITVSVSAGKPNINGTVALKIPEGWRAEPASIPFNIADQQAEKSLQFTLYPPAQSNNGEIEAMVTVSGKTYNTSLSIINYKHIPVQVLFPVASAKVVKVDLIKKGTRIGYLMGAGDEVPAALQQIGYEVTMLKDEDITLDNLARFDAVILGVRAYNTVERMNVYHNKLMEYVEKGGNLIVQYNTSRDIKYNPGPYPLTLSDQRVTAENAEVRFLLPDHPVLNAPNKITSADFEGWVQERGLYFPGKWSKEYEAVLSSNDPGGTPLNGSLLIAKHGKGNFIYTGLSWFRQLPAGVPGAYRLFSNLISLGK